MKRQIPDGHYEIELVSRLKEGEHKAFEEIYHIYKDRLIGNLLNILKSHELVEELVQDLFLNVWNKREEIDLNKSFKSYLFKIAANMAKNTIRRAYYDKRMRSRLLPLEERIYLHIEEGLLSEENKQLLERLLEKLPPKRRAIFTLCKIEGMSYKEVSEQLNISENTVNDHIRKANLVFDQFRSDPEVMGLFLAAYLCSNI